MAQVKTPEVTLEMFQALVDQVGELTKKVEELSSKSAAPRNTAEREMTEEDAKRILTGDLKDAKHNEAAQKLGLSYGQVYSCRGEYTFKGVHKQLKEQGFKNPWVKA
jgi:hypothetical protein